MAAAEKDCALRADRQSLRPETVSGGWRRPGGGDKPKLERKNFLDFHGCRVDLQDDTGRVVCPRGPAHLRDGQIEFSSARAPLALLDAVGGFDVLCIAVRAIEMNLPEDFIALGRNEGEEQV